MTRAIHALVDGLPVETVSIDDRGLQDGHGIFETCRVVNGRIPLWQLHHARLSATAARLDILVRDHAQLRPGRIARSIMNAPEARFGFPRSR